MFMSRPIKMNPANPYQICQKSVGLKIKKIQFGLTISKVKPIS